MLLGFIPLMKNKKLMKYLTIILLCIVTFSFTEEFSELKSYIDKIESGNMDVPYELIDSYEKIVPNHPVYLYLRGLAETDGEKSVEFYKKLYSIDPNHEYADNAAMKIGEYYYSKGLYVKSADWLKKIPVYYPRSEQSENGVDLFLKSLIIAGKKDTAMFYLKIIKNQIPDIVINEDYIQTPLGTLNYHRSHITIHLLLIAGFIILTLLFVTKTPPIWGFVIMAVEVLVWISYAIGSFFILL